MQPGLLDEMSGSTRGLRDPGGAAEGVAGPQEREAGKAEHQGSDAAPARLVADAVRTGAGDLLWDAGVSIRVPTISPAPARPNAYLPPRAEPPFTHRSQAAQYASGVGRSPTMPLPYSGISPL